MYWNRCTCGCMRTAFSVLDRCGEHNTVSYLEVISSSTYAYDKCVQAIQFTAVLCPCACRLHCVWYIKTSSRRSSRMQRRLATLKEVCNSLTTIYDVRIFIYGCVCCDCRLHSHIELETKHGTCGSTDPTS